MNKEIEEAIQNMNNFANGIDMSCVTAKDMKLVLTALDNSIPKQVIEKKQKEYPQNHIIYIFCEELLKENTI